MGTSFTHVEQKQNKSRKWFLLNNKKSFILTVQILDISQVLYNTLYLTSTPQHIHCYCVLMKLLEVLLGCGWRKIHQPNHKRGASHGEKTFSWMISLFMWKFLTANASNDQDLLRAAVSHGPLCYLHQHGEQGLLQSWRCQNIGLYFTFHSSYLCENHRVLRAKNTFTERIYAQGYFNTIFRNFVAKTMIWFERMLH